MRTNLWHGSVVHVIYSRRLVNHSWVLWGLKISLNISKDNRDLWWSPVALLMLGDKVCDVDDLSVIAPSWAADSRICTLPSDGIGHPVRYWACRWLQYICPDWRCRWQAPQMRVTAWFDLGWGHDGAKSSVRSWLLCWFARNSAPHTHYLAVEGYLEKRPCPTLNIMRFALSVTVIQVISQSCRKCNTTIFGWFFKEISFNTWTKRTFSTPWSKILLSFFYITYLYFRSVKFHHVNVTIFRTESSIIAKK